MLRQVKPRRRGVDINEVRMDSPFVDHRLENGLRIVIERMPEVKGAAAGFYSRTARQ